MGNVVAIIILISLVGTYGWIIHKENANRRKYLPIRSVDMDGEQRNYVRFELNKFKEMLERNNMYSGIEEVDSLIRKINDMRLRESDIKRLNELLEDFHSLS